MRALAVALVIGFHFWPLRLPGGYVGVDVFFVVSGFLITGILVRELASTGHIRLLSFYLRRARRLLPAAGFVLTTTAILTLAVVPLRDWNQILREIIGSSLYVQNWVLAADGTNYFLQQDYRASPVQHFWSLSVEEQFYLGWPLLLLVAALIARRARARERTYLILSAAIVTVGSLAASVLLTATAPESSYYWTHLRVWEFTAGALLALIMHRLPSSASASRYIAALGIGLIIGSSVLFDGETVFPGAAAAVPVVGSLLLLYAALQHDPFTRQVMGNRLAVWVGDRSYALYLWHWPAVVFAPLLLDRPLTTVDKVLLLAVTVALSDLTKRFIEDRFRAGVAVPPHDVRRTRRTLITSTTFAVLPAIVIAGGGLAGGAMSIAAAEARMTAAIEARGDCFGIAAVTPECMGTPEPPPSELIPGLDLAPRDDVNTPECWSSSTTSELRVCTYGASEPSLRVALIGDSHANQYLAAMHEIIRTSNWSFDVMGKAGCMFTSAEQVNSEAWVESCESWKDAVRQHVAEQRYDVVVTSNFAGSPVREDGAQSALETAEAGLVDEWSRLGSLGTQILVIRDNPVMDANYLECIERQVSGDYAECARPRDQALAQPDPQIAAVARVDAATLFDPTELLCTETHCPPVIGGVIAYRDSTHLTSTLTRTMASAVRDAIDFAARAHGS